jgi:hypothetical protein
MRLADSLNAVKVPAHAAKGKVDFTPSSSSEA